MQAVRARADGEVSDRGLPAIVLRADRAGLQLEFANGFRGRAELVIVTARKVGASNRHAFDQDLVRILLAPVDRSFERVTGGARQAVENELLDLPLSVADYHRPALVLFRCDVAA